MLVLCEPGSQIH